MSCSISVVIPARNAAHFLTRCLEALLAGSVVPGEILVVDDASEDETPAVAERLGARLLRTERKSGPAYARNLGANAAKGSILLFLDADVCVSRETVRQVEASFARDPQLDALMGSYDSKPDCPDFLSQYRNLMHAYVHHKGSHEASTFWSGCGAIRRDVFLSHSGFSSSYGRPAIEDIELGYRLKQANRKLELDPTIQVTHLKQWTFWGLLKTDILDRGIPWTELILRTGKLPNDLNLRLSQRVSVALVVMLVALAATVAIHDDAYLLIPPLAIIFLMLAAWWSEALIGRAPRTASAWVIAAFASVIALACWYRMYALIVPLALGPAILLLRHRYAKLPKMRRVKRTVGVVYILLTLIVAGKLMWGPHHLIFACALVLGVVALLNTEFYVFLAAQRGVIFMLAAIPFHLLYHFYNALSFAVGTAVHVFKSRTQAEQPQTLMAAAGGGAAVWTPETPAKPTSETPEA